MKVFFIKKKTFMLGISVILVLGMIIGLPVLKVDKQLSSDTKEYWNGSNDIIWDVNTKAKMIALTFDDGPSPEFTPQILDILKKNNINGTFFIIAKEAEKYPEIIRRMISEGNEIGSHTYNHPNLKGFTEKELEEELVESEKIIMGITGVKPICFRPPEGYYNKEIVEVAKKLNYTVVLWSWEQQTGDWANPGTSTIIRRVLKSPNKGNIVVFHDRGGDRTQTVQALQPIIDGLREKGFKLVSVSEMLKECEKN